MTVKLFDFVKITDENHKHYGRTGQLTDFDTIDGEYVMHFDKLTDRSRIVAMSFCEPRSCRLQLSS